MPNVTVSVPDDLRAEMSRHEEVNWSGVIRKAIQALRRKLAIADAIANKSKLSDKDVKELDRLVKKGAVERHGLA